MVVFGQFNIHAVTPTNKRVIIAADYDGDNHERTKANMEHSFHRNIALKLKICGKKHSLPNHSSLS